MLRLNTVFRSIALSVCFISVTEHEVSQTLGINLKRAFSLKKYLESIAAKRTADRAAEQAVIDDDHKAAIQKFTDYKNVRIQHGEDAFMVQLMREYEIYTRRLLRNTETELMQELRQSLCMVQMELEDFALIREALLAGPYMTNDYIVKINRRIGLLTIGGAYVSGHNIHHNQISKLDQVNTQLKKYHSALVYVRNREERLRRGGFHPMHSLSGDVSANEVAELLLQRKKNEEQRLRGVAPVSDEQVRVDEQPQVVQVVTGVPVTVLSPVVGVRVDLP